MLGRIYLITNIANGKKYVGQTVQTGKRRFNAHKRDAFKYLYGKHHSEESLKKMSASHVGNQVGEKHPRSKLTEKDVLEIRAAVTNGASRMALAKQFGVGKTAIDKIVRRHTWSHI